MALNIHLAAAACGRPSEPSFSPKKNSQLERLWRYGLQQATTGIANSASMSRDVFIHLGRWLALHGPYMVHFEDQVLVWAAARAFSLAVWHLECEDTSCLGATNGQAGVDLQLLPHTGKR